MALPVRSKFRFTANQKKILFELFIKGERTGNKVSPEEADISIRQQLPPTEYVKPQQIRHD